MPNRERNFAILSIVIKTLLYPLKYFAARGNPFFVILLSMALLLLWFLCDLVVRERSRAAFRRRHQVRPNRLASMCNHPSGATRTPHRVLEFHLLSDAFRRPLNKHLRTLKLPPGEAIVVGARPSSMWLRDLSPTSSEPVQLAHDYSAMVAQWQQRGGLMSPALVLLAQPTEDETAAIAKESPEFGKALRRERSGQKAMDQSRWLCLIVFGFVLFSLALQGITGINIIRRPQAALIFVAPIISLIIFVARRPTKFWIAPGRIIAFAARPWHKKSQAIVYSPTSARLVVDNLTRRAGAYLTSNGRIVLATNQLGAGAYTPLALYWVSTAEAPHANELQSFFGDDALVAYA